MTFSRGLLLLAAALAVACDDSARSSGGARDGGPVGGDGATDARIDDAASADGAVSRDAAPPADAASQGDGPADSGAPADSAGSTDTGVADAAADARSGDGAPRDAAPGDGGGGLPGEDARLDVEPRDAEVDGGGLPGEDARLDVEPRDAEVDARPEAGADGGTDAGGVSDASPDGALDAGHAADAAEPGAAALPPPFRAPSCQLRAPALLYDRIFLVDDLALRTGDLFDPGPPPVERFVWDAGWSPLAPVAAAAASGPEVFVALVGDGGCQVRAFDRDGAAQWLAEPVATGCTHPAVAGPWLLLPVSTVGGGELLVLDRNDGAVVSRAPLSGRATAPVVRIPGGDGDPRGHSGSHWLVGADGGVALFTLDDGPALRPRATFDLPDGAVTELVGVDAGLAAAILRREGDSGLGGAWIGLDLQIGPDAARIAALGPPVATPGPVLTPPVAGRDCDDPLAHSGSHWWCPGGVFAVGGEGFVDAYDVARGEAIAGDRIPDLRITGLALTADGSLMHSGSHWFPRESRWTLGRLDPLSGGPSAELHFGQAGPETCAESPLVAEDGRVAGVIGQAGAASFTYGVGTNAGGLAPVWARAGGTNQGSGAAVEATAPCPGGAKPQYSRPVEPLAGRDVRAMAVLPGGGVALAGGVDGVPGASPPWMARLDEAGFPLWVRSYPAEGADRFVFRHVIADGDGLAAVQEIQIGADPQSIRFLRVDGDGEVVRDVPVDLGTDVRPVRLLQRADQTFVVLVRRVAAQLGEPESSLLFLDADGGPVREVMLDSANGIHANDFLEFRDGFVIAGAQVLPVVTAGHLEGVNEDGDQLWLDTIERGIGTVEFTAVDQRVDGEIVATVHAVDGDLEESLFRRYFPNGIPRTEGTLGAVKAIDLAAAHGSTFYVLTEDMEVTHVTVNGGVGSTRQALPASAGRLGVALESDPSTGLFVVGVGGEAGAPTPFVERTDAWNGASCGASGLCVGFDPTQCDDREPCTEDFCDPDTGACATRALADGNPCSEGVFCLGGECR